MVKFYFIQAHIEENAYECFALLQHVAFVRASFAWANA